MNTFAIDCYTTADDTWSCGTPTSSDNLIVSHKATFANDFTTTGNITISNGGNLTITGNFNASNCTIFIESGTINVAGNISVGAQCAITVNGNLTVDNNLIVNSNGSLLVNGATSINGNVILNFGSSFIMKRDSDVTINKDFTNNSNATEIDGVLSISEGIINNNLITGIGEISFSTCSGTGLINDVTNDIYCASSPIDLFSSHCSATDNEDPKFVDYPSNITSYLDMDNCEQSIAWATPTVSDNCSIDELVASHKPGSLFPVGTTTVTYTVFDKASNSAVINFEVSVLDTISPSITGLPNVISVEAELATCGATISWNEPTVIDNCSAGVSSDFKPGDFFPIGNYVVSYTAIDPSGNTTIKTFDIEVTNPHLPTFTSCPKDTLIYTNTSSCELAVYWEEPVTTGCGVNITQTHSPGDLFSIGIHNVSYTASDISSNSAACSFTIQVLDTIPPLFTLCPQEFRIESVDSIAKQSIITWEEPIAEDLCTEVKLNSNYQPGDAFDFGTTTVIYTAVDDFGNESVCNFDVQSGVNNPPRVESQELSVKAGELVKICMIAKDPDGDEIAIKTIKYDERNAVISDIDSAGLCFSYTSFEDFEGTDIVTVSIIDSGLPQYTSSADIVIDVIRERIIETASVITTNGDGINDAWIISNIDLYPDNSVHVFDPWGGLLYETTGYNNNDVVWDGTNKNGDYVLTGTYFFAIDLGDGQQKITGALEVIR